MTQGRSGRTGHMTGKATAGRKRRKSSKRNQRVLLRWIGVAAALVVAILLLVRCAGGRSGKSAAVIDETASRVEFTKKGALTVTSVESFDKDYYDQEELQAAIDTAVSAYKDQKGGVSAGDLKVENGTATLTMQYDSAADYTAFNDQEMYWGTLQGAEDAGYDFAAFSGQTNAQNKDETFGEGTARTLAENTVIVVTEALDIITPADILYASSNLSIADTRYATVTGDVSESSPAILILQ